MQMTKLEKLEILAKGFGELRKKVVFSGGMLTALYATDKNPRDHRSMGEIECIVDAPTMAEFIYWDQNLRKKGFSPKYDPTPPVVEWEYNGIRLEVLPQRPEIVRRNNRWFEEGLFHAVSYELPSRKEIRLLQAPYFLATRIESFLHHGNFNFKKSKDFEDIIYLLDNRFDLIQEINESFYEVRGYIQGFFRQLMAHPSFEEGLHYALPFHAGYDATEKIWHLMEEISSQTPSLASY